MAILSPFTDSSSSMCVTEKLSPFGDTPRSICPECDTLYDTCSGTNPEFHSEFKVSASKNIPSSRALVTHRLDQFPYITTNPLYHFPTFTLPDLPIVPVWLPLTTSFKSRLPPNELHSAVLTALRSIRKFEV